MFMKKLIVLMFIVCLLISMVGCGGSNNFVIPYPEEKDLFLAKVVDSTSDIQFIAVKDGEVLAFLAEKDTEGNPIGVKGVAYLSSEDEYMAIVPGEDGLPETIIDSKGNRIEFKNYTDSTVDVYWYNEYDELIEGPVTVDVDEQDLLELQQINSSLESKMARGKTNDIIKWSILGINGIICVGGLYITAGIPSPIYGICASTILGVTAALTENEILDAADFTVDGATCVAAGGLSFSCISLLNTIGEEMSDWDSNSNPIIDALIAESTYVKTGETVNIDCYVDDADEFENFTFWWQAEDGDFIAMPYIYQTNLPSWESNVPWKCKSTIIWTASNTAGNYEIVCTVIDKAGETDSKSVSISVEGTNHAPIISSLTADPSSININETTTITCTASDEDVGDMLTYNWTKNVGSFEGSTSGPSVTWRAPSTADIYTVVSCEVSDGEGGEDSESINIIVTEPDDNHAPVITSTAVTSATKDEPYSYDVDATDVDTLTYSLTTKPSGMTIISTTGVINWTPTATGSFGVTVKASDGKLFDTQSFTITVSESSPPPPTGVDASDGQYNYMVRITWNSVSGASHYRVYRSGSSGGTKTPISSWQTNTSFDDSSVDTSTYYYWVKAATSSSGDNASPYSDYDEGYRSKKNYGISIFVANPAYGTTSPPPGTYSAEEGSTYVIIALPGSGHTFDYWSGDNDGSSTSIMAYVFMDGDKVITAHFK